MTNRLPRTVQERLAAIDCPAMASDLLGESTEFAHSILDVYDDGDEQAKKEIRELFEAGGIRMIDEANARFHARTANQ